MTSSLVELISPSSEQRILLMGSTGRVSQLLLKHWCAAPSPTPIWTQSRKVGFDLTWSPIEDGPEPLVGFTQTNGPLSAVVAMIGATPSTSGDMSDTAALAEAVVSAAEIAGVPRVLLASSSAVYAIGEGLSEGDVTAPTSPYGQVKLEMEQAVSRLDASVEVCCLRIGNVAGADALLGRSRDVSVENPISLDQFPDGKGPLRSYISPSQLALCLERLVDLKGPLPPILNCAAEPPVEMADLVQAANLPWVWSCAPASRLSTQRITLDCTLLEQTIGRGCHDASPRSMIADLRRLGALN